MRKIVSLLFFILTLNTLTLSSQTIVFQYEDDKSYCTIEIDTTLSIKIGTYRAYKHLNVPYYEMAFTPEFQYTEGKTIVSMTPTWHNQAYLEKVYGEPERAQKDNAFKIKFALSSDGSQLELLSTDEEIQNVFNKSSYSKKGQIKMTDLPKTFTKVQQVNMEKFPKGLRKNLQKRANKIRSRLN